jgi:predicted heme/steroid binding protein
LEVKDVDDPSIDDLNLSEIDAMNNWAEKLAAKYPIVGHLVVPMEERDYTLEELAQYNGKGWLICWFVGLVGLVGLLVPQTSSVLFLIYVFDCFEFPFP